MEDFEHIYNCIDTKMHFFFIGILGVSQSKLALILKNFGCKVSGSDRSTGENKELLERNGIKVYTGHSAKNIKSAQIVVYNGAISDDNVELKAAKKNSLVLVKRSALLATVANMYKHSVAVCGSHGKTTVTGLLAYVLKGLCPQMHIGGDLMNKPFEISPNRGLFVSEACEFKRSFLDMTPSVSVMLNIDADHLDCYKDIDEIEEAFLTFANQTKNVIVYNYADERVSRVVKRAQETRKELQSISYGTDGDFSAKKIKQTKKGLSFVLCFQGKAVNKIVAKLFGLHNVENILASIATAFVFGIFPTVALSHLSSFGGVKRRMEFLGKLSSNIVIHDYAHHPKEIVATIKATKKHFGKKVIAVFEPHTFSRTQALWEDFVTCFGEAEYTYFLPIYSAREKARAGITSQILSNSVKRAEFVDTKEQLKGKLSKYKNRIILIMGAGSVEKIAYFVAGCGN